MKRFELHFAVFFVALATVAGFAALDAATGRVRSQEAVNRDAAHAEPGLKTSAAESSLKPTATESSSKPTAAVRERRAEPAAEATSAASAFDAAATRNAALRVELGWTFGGKQQRGWHLYAPLINRLIEAEHDPATGDFAAALSRWQTRAGLRPSGVLDQESLYAMVSTWQGARLKQRGYPQPDQLLTAPPADFYDPARPDELRQVERETYAAYKRMVAAAAQDPALRLEANAAGELAPAEKYLKIVSSFRSREYQARLRRMEPHAGRAALAVHHSPHFTGRALDLYVGGEPVETKDSNRAIQVQTPAYRWLVRNAERFGFRPYYYEPWHWEYVGTTVAAK